MENKKEQPKKKNPLQTFFSLGDKITKGDPVRKAQFDYSFMWMLFLAFVTICLRNWFFFVKTWDIGFLAWGCVGLAISWFQFFALRQFYNVKNNVEAMYAKKQQVKPEPIKLEEDSFDDMLKEFEDGKAQE